MGETRKARGLPDAAGGHSAGRVPARFSLKAFARDRGGATAIEYGLIVSLIFLAIITALGGFGEKTTALIDYISEEISKSI